MRGTDSAAPPRADPGAWAEIWRWGRLHAGDKGLFRPGGSKEDGWEVDLWHRICSYQVQKEIDPDINSASENFLSYDS